jgi:hypothetical protein
MPWNLTEITIRCEQVGYIDTSYGLTCEIRGTTDAQNADLWTQAFLFSLNGVDESGRDVKCERLTDARGEIRDGAFTAIPSASIYDQSSNPYPPGTKVPYWIFIGDGHLQGVTEIAP